MEVVVESSQSFEKDLDRLGEQEKAITVNKINDCANLFPDKTASVYRQLHSLPLLSDLNGYEPSLYFLTVSPKSRVILTVDEDPIFGQVIITLFRVVKHDELNQAYQDVAKSLYQELFHNNRKTVKI